MNHVERGPGVECSQRTVHLQDKQPRAENEQYNLSAGKTQERKTKHPMDVQESPSNVSHPKVIFYRTILLS